MKNNAYYKHLGVTLDRTLSKMEHIHNTKVKVAKRNNLIGTCTPRTTALDLCYSVVQYAVYAAPVWSRSKHAHLLDLKLKQACRTIQGCLKPTKGFKRRSLYAVELSQWSSKPLRILCLHFLPPAMVV